MPDCANEVTDILWYSVVLVYFDSFLDAPCAAMGFVFLQPGGKVSTSLANVHFTTRARNSNLPGYKKQPINAYH